MALGAITNALQDPHSSTQQIPIAIGDIKLTVTNVVPSAGADYPTGGVQMTPQQLGLTTVLASQAEVIGSAANNGASGGVLLPTNKLQLFTTGTTGANVEVANGTNLTGCTVNIIAFGY